MARCDFNRYVRALLARGVCGAEISIGLIGLSLDLSCMFVCVRAWMSLSVCMHVSSMWRFRRAGKSLLSVIIQSSKHFASYKVFS